MSIIKLLVTGGTIDKVYDEINGNLTFDETHISVMLDQARCLVEISMETVMLKDSLEMSDSDRNLISQQCVSCGEDKIIISHGTDTMVETAATLARALSELKSKKTIILFGAMIPFTINHSDSLFNLGCAISAVQCLNAGVYITMNGQIFPWDDVRKNKTKGLFQTKS